MSASSPENMNGKTAVVTGSSRGIGRAIARALAEDGTHVLVHARKDKSGAEETSAEICSAGNQSTIVLGDLADGMSRAELVEQAWCWRGGVDVWVNNAGADVLTGEAAGWPFDRKLEQLWNVDVTATIDLSRRVGARMKARGGGVILNMGWDQADRGMAGDSGEMFAAVKGAVMAFTRSLARSLAPQVRVNCLAPGWIRTAWGERASEDWQQRAAGESLLQRWGTPRDVAAVARFLASDQASFINGQIIPINGGFRTAGD